MRTNLQPEIATTGAQPFATKERYGGNVPLAGSVRTGLAMTIGKCYSLFTISLSMPNARVFSDAGVFSI